MSSWKESKATAEKLLGKDGKLPKPRVDIGTIYDPIQKAWEAWDKSKGDLESKTLSVQKGLADAKLVCTQYFDMIDGNDFGLKKDDPNDKKRIEAVTKILKTELQHLQSIFDQGIEELAKLDRVLTNLDRLKNVKI